MCCLQVYGPAELIQDESSYQTPLVHAEAIPADEQPGDSPLLWPVYHCHEINGYVRPGLGARAYHVWLISADVNDSTIALGGGHSCK